MQTGTSVRTRTTCQGGLYAGDPISSQSESLFPLPPAAHRVFSTRHSAPLRIAGVVSSRPRALADWPRPAAKRRKSAAHGPSRGYRAGFESSPSGAEESIQLVPNENEILRKALLHPQSDAQTSQKMLNLGNNREGNPLSRPSKFGIRHNLRKIDNVLHGTLTIS